TAAGIPAGFALLAHASSDSLSAIRTRVWASMLYRLDFTGLARLGVYCGLWHHHRVRISRCEGPLHRCGNDLLGTQTIAVRGWKWQTFAAAVHECLHLGFVG